MTSPHFRELIEKTDLDQSPTSNGWANPGSSPAFCRLHYCPENSCTRYWQRAEGEYVATKGIMEKLQRGRNRLTFSLPSRLAVMQLKLEAGEFAWWELREGSEEEGEGGKKKRIHFRTNRISDSAFTPCTRMPRAEWEWGYRKYVPERGKMLLV